jgi:membrane-bound metal-dependent hydrolase YbcI (DUF457 family)
MDVLTHTFAAVTLGLAGHRRWGWKGTACLTAAAAVPELERFAALGGAAVRVEAGYGAGHSLLVVPFAALLVAALVRRWLGGWKTALQVVAIALFSHLALDLLSGPGVRLLWPLWPGFSGRAIAAHYDLLILLTLGLGLAVPQLLNLVNRDIGAASYNLERPARIALLAVALLLVARAVMAMEMDRRLTDASISDFDLAPSAIHPLSWFLIRDTGPGYTIEEVTPRGFGPPLRFRKPQPNRAFETAAESRLGRAFLEMARFPQYSLERGDKGMRVRIRDLRFFTPGGDGRQYSIEIEVSPELEVVSQKAIW